MGGPWVTSMPAVHPHGPMTRTATTAADTAVNAINVRRHAPITFAIGGEARGPLGDRPNRRAPAGPGVTGAAQG